MQTISFRPSTPSMRSLPIGKADFVVVFNSSGTARPNGWICLCLTASRRCATSSNNTTAPHGPSMRHVDGIVQRMARDPSCQNRKTTHHHSTPKASTKFNRWWAAPCTMVEQLIQQCCRRSTQHLSGTIQSCRAHSTRCQEASRLPCNPSRRSHSMRQVRHDPTCTWRRLLLVSPEIKKQARRVLLPKLPT